MNFNVQSDAERMAMVEREARAAFKTERAIDNANVAHFLSVVGPQIADVDDPRLRAAAIANAVAEYKKQRPSEFASVENFRDRNVKPDQALSAYADQLRRHDRQRAANVPNFRDPNVNPEKALARYKASLI